MWEILAAAWSAFAMVVVSILAWRATRPAASAPLDSLDSRLRERVVVTCKDGSAFIGVLFEADERALVLRDAAAVAAGEDRTNLPLDGELVLLLAEVAYLQRAWVDGGGA